jgi:hypothetical protein
VYNPSKKLGFFVAFHQPIATAQQVGFSVARKLQGKRLATEISDDAGLKSS